MAKLSILITSIVVASVFALALTACAGNAGYTENRTQYRAKQQQNNQSRHYKNKPKKAQQKAHHSIVSLQWPAEGLINPHAKSVDINGKAGTPIKAAADGMVVYSGNGLKQYGNLLIIKHNEDFLTVYAHNQELKVKEGVRVTKGQLIALMGKSAAERVKLHFEVRYQGKPQDPLKFLPKI